MEGLTDGKIVGVSGHGVDYWARDKRILMSEAFTHIFELQFYEERYKVMRKYFPKS